MKRYETEFIKKDIERYFEFLFKRGYKIQSIEYSPEHFGNWLVVLISKESIIEIYCERNELFLAFRSLNIKQKPRIGLKAMIYFLSQGEKIIPSYKGNLFWGKRKQFEILANLLQEYIDQITPFFNDNFPKYELDLVSAQSKYNHLILEQYN